MTTFEITIRRRSDDGWPVVALWNPEGILLPVRNEGLLKLDTLLLSKQITPQVYSTMLGKALFRDDIVELWTAAESQAALPHGR